MQRISFDGWKSLSTVSYEQGNNLLSWKSLGTALLAEKVGKVSQVYGRDKGKRQRVHRCEPGNNVKMARDAFRVLVTINILKARGNVTVRLAYRYRGTGVRAKLTFLVCVCMHPSVGYVTAWENRYRSGVKFSQRGDLKKLMLSLVPARFYRRNGLLNVPFYWIVRAANTRRGHVLQISIARPNHGETGVSLRGVNCVWEKRWSSSEQRFWFLDTVWHIRGNYLPRERTRFRYFYLFTEQEIGNFDRRNERGHDQRR